MASASAAFWFSLAGVRSVCGSSRTSWRELSFPLTLALHSVGCPWSSRAHGVRRRAISRLSRLPSMLTCSGVSGDCGAASIESKRVDTTSKIARAVLALGGTGGTFGNQTEKSNL